MRNTPDETVLAPSTAIAVGDLAEIIGSTDESFLKEVMVAAGGLYSDYEKKEEKLRSDAEGERRRVMDVDEKWRLRKEELGREEGQIWGGHIENPVFEYERLIPKIGDVRWNLLSKVFNGVAGVLALNKIIESTNSGSRSVKSILRAFFVEFFRNPGSAYNGSETRAQEFFTNYKFDTGSIDADLFKFINLFLAVQSISESNETAYSESYSKLLLKKSPRFHLSELFRNIGLDDKWTNLMLDENDFRKQSASDEWTNNIVKFLLQNQVEKGQAGDRKINNAQDFQRELVRFTEYGIYKDKREKASQDNAVERESNFDANLSEPRIAERMRESDELKMQFPDLWDHSKGRKLESEYDIPVMGMPPRPYYFAKVGKGKYPNYVAEEFGRVIFKKFIEGDHKDIIEPMRRNMGISLDSLYDFKELRETEKSAFVKHLPTVARVHGFTAKDKARLGELEKKYGSKPDEYAEKLYDLYNLAIYFHKLGETVYDKAANEAQKKAGLEKMLFAAGLTRVLERMLATLEVRLAVMKVSRGTDIPEFLQFAEALEVMAKNPLSRQLEKVIDDSLNKFRAAIETTKAE